MQIIENENGTFKLTATNEMENRLVASLSDLVFNAAHDEEIANNHGCVIETDDAGNETAYNYVTIPEAEIFAEEFEAV